MKKKTLRILVWLFLLVLPLRGGISLLHKFAIDNGAGCTPYGDLTLSGSTLFGMTSYGGDSNYGTIFKIKTDGSGYTLLYSFAGGADDGKWPFGSLIISGSTLYGMTEQGGTIDEGTVFKIETDGSGYTLLHKFAGGADEGAGPKGSLILSGSILYGMTQRGGDSDSGTIFKIGTDGNGFTLLHEFAGGADDGARPYGSLIISSSTLYGMTSSGGNSGRGTIFKMQADGSGFALLHEFAGGAADGSEPYGFLILSGSTFYGMTIDGGDSGIGTVFKVQTDGSGYTLLHAFDFDATDGQQPYGSLILSGSILYGMTIWGGANDDGTIFKIQTNGSGFALLHEFAGGADDGEEPYGSLILSGSTLYGMTSNEGGYLTNLRGTVFKIQTNGSGYALLHKFTGRAGPGANPSGDLVISGSTLYGMTEYGGASDAGTIFKVQTDGSGYTLLHEFAWDGDGARPHGSLIISGSTLYGMTTWGGYSDRGTLFKLQTDGSGYTSLYKFSGGGREPYGSLILSGSTLYGMTEYCDSGYGTIFKIETAGTGFTVLHEFTGGADDGEYPKGALVISGTTLYGMTHWGGDSDDDGTIFKLGTDGSGYTLLRKFAGGPYDGSSPEGSLLISGSTLYGMTAWGGAGGDGTIFTMQTDGSGFTLIHEFAGGAADGRAPVASLTLSGSTLYGMTLYGGSSISPGNGTIFKMQTNGAGFTLLHGFAGGPDDGKNPNGSLILSGSTLYGMTCYGGDSDAGVIFSLPMSIIVTAPNGGENWNSGDVHNITWTSTGFIANVNIDYSINNGGSWSPVAANTANDGMYAWTVPATLSAACLVRVSDAVDSNLSDISDRAFSISSSAAETVSTPSQPAGANSGLKSTSYPFTTDGSTSNLGHSLQYKFDWDDGSDSGWLAAGTTGASHSWAANDTYHVRAMARCVSDTGVESLWSDTHVIIISASGTSGKYNAPAQQKILPEVIWASATGGGTWMSAVQVTDISGGSQVSVYYNTTAGRRGPFLLWNNSSGGALSSVKYTNLLQTIDGLDSGVFTYSGTVGAVEFVTQDVAHVLQVTARTLNGNYSKTLPAFSLHDSNTASTTRVMIIPNLTNNSAYRSTCGMFNPSADAVTVELRLMDSTNNQIGTTISKTLGGHGFTSFSPFSEAGQAYPAYSYDNVILSVQPISGMGKVLCFGASANNVTNDPAAHIAVQSGSGHDNGPGSLQILPEAIWAPATGGGTWMSAVQVVDMSGGSAVSITFDYGGGNRRGPFLLWTGSVAGAKVKYSNILQIIDGLDSQAFTYSGRVGTLEFATQDGSHFIQVTARTLNGNYSKTFPGLNLVEAETADTSRVMLIQNYTNNKTYRSTCGFFNPTAASVTVEFTLLNGSGAQIGTPFSKTLVGYDFRAFSPFNEAGVPYPANSYDNVILRVRPTSGSGQVVCFGASANNASNDPAAHLAVQGQ